MALWTVSEFLTHAGHLTVGENHELAGDDLARVVTALECWHEVKISPDKRVLEAGLYTVLKECRRWLKANNGPDPTRKNAVEALLKMASSELGGISEALVRSLDDHQGIKSAGKIAQPGGDMRGLAPGYSFERNYYTANQKKGRVLSATDFAEHFKHDEFTSFDTQQVLGRIEVEKTSSVLFLNKIARLKYLVMPREGLLVDIDYKPSLMVKKSTGGYTPLMYAMDRHGALFVRTDERPQDYVVQTDKGPQVESRENTYMNHSSFLAGREAICAGYIHIGLKWDESNTWKEEGGYLAAISNNSGHYKPSTEDLRRCVLTLQQNGINVDHTRVGFMNPTGNLVFSQGCVFLKSGVGEWDGAKVGKPVWAPPIIAK